ncbi:MAG TPA: WYL domain-containing protein [Flavobacterium sp.]|nr:WYL domain-containing protein [Flavobacterium sp.]
MASKHHLISRLIRIVELFQLHGISGLSFEELNEKLKSTYEEDDFRVSLRTFQRDLKDIESSLSIKIIFDKSIRKYVLDENSLNGQTQNYQQFAIESLKVFNIAQDAASLDFVFVNERKVSGLEHYPVIKEAIVHKKYLLFTYQKFDQYKSDQRKIIPQALIENKNRWYIAGFEVKDGKEQTFLKTFALDRILNADAGLQVLSQKSVDIKKYFKDFFGISTRSLNNFAEVVDVHIETSIEYGKYFRTLPMHASQQIKTENGKTIVMLRLIPTMDFVAELLSHNTQIKVTKPPELIEVLKKILQENLAQYN